VVEFLDNLLQKGGVVAVLFAVVLIAFFLTVKALWNQNQSLHRELLKAQKDHDDSIKELQKKVMELQEAFTAKAAELQSQYNRLQDKRVSEAQQVTTQVVEHAHKIDGAMEKFRISQELLIDIMKNLTTD